VYCVLEPRRWRGAVGLGDGGVSVIVGISEI
jgi:hypothetical protein